jgi:hypothetical protein
MLRKAFVSVEIKAAGRGARAVFSTYNVIDSDGDVTMPGAFETGAVVPVSAFNHSSWGAALPVGTATIRDLGGWAEADVSWFDTAAGRETGATVKALADEGLGEWSYGYDVLDWSRGEFAGQDVRFLKRVKTFEVSPVLVGAGVNTRTLEASARDTAIGELRRYIALERRRALSRIRDRVAG